MTDSRSRNTTLLTMCIQIMHGYIIRKLEWSWDFVAIDESAKLMSGQKIPSCNNEGLGSMTSIWQYEMSCGADQIKWPSVWWNESIGTLGVTVMPRKEGWNRRFDPSLRFLFSIFIKGALAHRLSKPILKVGCEIFGNLIFPFFKLKEYFED